MRRAAAAIPRSGNGVLSPVSSPRRRPWSDHDRRQLERRRVEGEIDFQVALAGTSAGWCGVKPMCLTERCCGTGRHHAQAVAARRVGQGGAVHIGEVTTASGSGARFRRRG